MKEKKSGLKRRLAAYFGVSFLLPAAGAFYLLYHFVASEFGIEVRERSVAVEKMIQNRTKSAVNRINKAVDTIYSKGEFTALLYSFRKDTMDYADWVEFGTELSGSSSVDDVVIYDEKGIIVTSRLQKANYGIEDKKSLNISEGQPYFSVIEIDGKERLLLMAPKFHTLPGNRVLKLCAGIFFDDELISFGGLYDKTYVRLKIGDKEYSDLPEGALLLADAGKAGGSPESLSAKAKVSKAESDFVVKEVFKSESLEGVPVRMDLIYSIEPLKRISRSLYVVALLLILSGIVFSVIFGLMISRPFTRRLEELLRAMRLAASGETKNVQLNFKTGDDFETISGTFNRLVEDIAVQQKKLIEAERIRTWQDIARKMAHEIKNPLSPIRVSAETLMKAFRKKPEGFEKILEESTSVISEEVQRIRKIVDEFVEFARLPAPKKTLGDLNRVIEQASSLYRGMENIKIELQPGEVRRFFFDPDQITRVVHNLLKNAVEAFSGAGEIVIETAERASFEEPVAVVTVTDNGPGITDEVKSRLFTPYLTTKKDGSGLGLNICRRIVMEHGGSIELDNKPGTGTKITFTLPLKEETEEIES
jgi:signal transduction histidine kinase